MKRPKDGGPTTGGSTAPGPATASWISSTRPVSRRGHTATGLKRVNPNCDSAMVGHKSRLLYVREGRTPPLSTTILPCLNPLSSCVRHQSHYHSVLTSGRPLDTRTSARNLSLSAERLGVPRSTGWSFLRPRSRSPSFGHTTRPVIRT